MNSFFDIERLRDRLAAADELVKFRKTYTNQPDGLRNLNTKTFWNSRIKNEYKGLVNSPIYSHKIAIVLGYLCKQKGRLLDIGFGYGHVEYALSKAKSELSLYGVDISDVAIQMLGKKVKGNFRIGSICKLPYKSSFFDVVLVLDVLEHLPVGRVFEAYLEIWRVLKKNGIFILSIPLNEGLEELVKYGENPGGHLRDYTASIIKAELKMSKFKILKTSYLYAFRNYYYLKSFIIKNLLLGFRKPNQVIVMAQK